MTPSTAIQFLVDGAFLGSVYSLVALSLALIFGVMDIADFAQGAVYTVGAYVGFFVLQAMRTSYFLALGAAVIAAGGLGIANYALAYRPLERALGANTMIAALGILVILENAVHLVAGSDYRYLASPFGDAKLALGGAIITYHRLFVVVATAALLLFVWLFLHRTRIGRGLRALAQNRTGAILSGVNVAATSMATFALASGLAGLAGLLMAPIQPLSPTMGGLVILKAFAIVIFAGLGSIPGVIAGSLIIGIGEVLATAYVAAEYADLVAFLLLIGILLVRPRGIFGKA